VSREEDLIEEVVRHYGLARVPAELPPARLPGGLPRAQRRERRLRDALVGAGLQEVVNYGFGAPRAVVQEPARVPLKNPLSAELSILRPSLLAGLLENLVTNQRQGQRNVSLFEIGRVFEPAPGLPRERRSLAVVLTGQLRPGHWGGPPEPSDFFTVKGLLEAAAARLGQDGLEIAERGTPPSHWHPGRSAEVRWQGRALGWVGELSRAAAQAFDLADRVTAAEVDLEPWLEAEPKARRVQALDRFPAVTRDLSLVMDEGTAAADLLRTVTASAGARLRSVAVLDRYAGGSLPSGKVSVTVSLRFQDKARTLTSDEVDADVAAVARSLREAGAEIRGL
jgi:phenylalanyl-tRNA synthetase beta chain